VVDSAGVVPALVVGGIAVVIALVLLFTFGGRKPVFVAPAEASLH